MSEEPSHEYRTLKSYMKTYLEPFDEIDLDLIDEEDFDTAFADMLIEFTNKLGDMTVEASDEEEDDY